MKSMFLALMFAIPAAPAVQARAVSAEPCACRTEADWKSEAQNHGWFAQGYLYSFETRQIRKFKNSGDAGTAPAMADLAAAAGAGRQTHDVAQTNEGGNVGANGIEIQVSWQTVEPEYQAYFGKLLALRDATLRPLSAIQVRYQMPADATDSKGNHVGGYGGYDLVNNPAHNLNMSDYLAEKRTDIFGHSDVATIADKLTNVLQSIDKVLTKGELLQVTIVLTFADGSTMEYVDKGNTTTDRVKGSGRDRNNNPILDSNTIDGRGDYSVAGGDVAGWVRNMEHLGVDIPGPGNVGTGTHTVTYSCTWNPAKGSLTCRKVSE